MTDSDNHQINLGAFFKDAREPVPELSEALMTGILADAGDVAASRQVAAMRAPVRRKGWLARLMEPMGGVQGMAAVGICAALGVTVGYAGTDALQSIPGVGDIVTSISGDPLDDFAYGDITSFTDFLAEG